MSDDNPVVATFGVHDATIVRFSGAEWINVGVRQVGYFAGAGTVSPEMFMGVSPVMALGELPELHIDTKVTFGLPEFEMTTTLRGDQVKFWRNLAWPSAKERRNNFKTNRRWQRHRRRLSRGLGRAPGMRAIRLGPVKLVITTSTGDNLLLEKAMITI